MIALYARVSTRDKHQDPETQLVQLRAWAAEQGQPATEYVDMASGKDLNRPAWKEMMREVNRGRIKSIAVLRIDRAFRSVIDGATTLAHLEALGVRFVPLAERHMDTGTPIGKAMIQMSMVWAELERETIRARVNDGLHRAKLEGKRIGRARKPLSIQRARAAVQEHGSVAAAARALEVPRSLLRRRLAENPGASTILPADDETARG